jgi:hypothetical protein
VFSHCVLAKPLTPLTPSAEKSNCAYPGSHATCWRCCGSPSRRRHRLSHPLQCLSTSRAFRLTPGRAWSIDTPSHMHTSTARAEVPARALLEGGGVRMCCPHCQHDNREGTCFCAASGKSCASKCPACDKPPRPGAAFGNHRGPPSRNDDCCHTPPAGPLTVDTPDIHPSASHREDPGLLRRPGREDTQGAVVANLATIPLEEQAGVIAHTRAEPDAVAVGLEGRCEW